MGVDGITNNTTVTTNTDTNGKNKPSNNDIDMKDFYIYDEEGNIIGVDHAKLAAAQNQARIASEMQGIQMESMQIQQDRFVREAQVTAVKKAEEAEEAADKQAEITGTIDDINDYINYQGNQGFDLSSFSSEYAQDVKELEKLAEQLTKPNASNTTVINGSAKFISKANDVKEQGKTIAEQIKEEENAEVSVDTDKYNEIYNLETYETENFFANNPFMDSELATTDVDEDEKAVA